MVQILSGIQSTAAALDAERTRIDVISENIANANTTRGLDGKPYQRQVVVFETALQQAMNGDAGSQLPGLQVARIQKDTRPAEMVYNPGSPDADASGYVHMPNVDIATETVDLMVARRMHEANASVFQAAKGMLRRALEI